VILCRTVRESLLQLGVQPHGFDARSRGSKRQEVSVSRRPEVEPDVVPLIVDRHRVVDRVFDVLVGDSALAGRRVYPHLRAGFCIHLRIQTQPFPIGVLSPVVPTERVRTVDQAQLSCPVSAGSISPEVMAEASGSATRAVVLQRPAVACPFS
jgi:hypothetical protein